MKLPFQLPWAIYLWIRNCRYLKRQVIFSLLSSKILLRPSIFETSQSPGGNVVFKYKGRQRSKGKPGICWAGLLCLPTWSFQWQILGTSLMLPFFSLPSPVFSLLNPRNFALKWISKFGHPASSHCHSLNLAPCHLWTVFVISWHSPL